MKTALIWAVSVFEERTERPLKMPMISTARKIKPRRWTPAQRAAASMRARITRPWRHATGPRTAAGKACSRLNARKHGRYDAEMCYLRAVLRRQRAFLYEVHGALWWTKPTPKPVFCDHVKTRPACGGPGGEGEEEGREVTACRGRPRRCGTCSAPETGSGSRC